MSESQPAIPPMATPPIPVVSPSSTSMAAYVEAFQAKEIRMKKSFQRATVWLVALGGLFLALAIGIGEISPYLIAANNWVAGLVSRNNWPIEVFVLINLIVPAVSMILLIQVCPLFLVWWERKVSAHMQGRLGPMDVGGWHGWAQTIADGIKLFLKEIIEPDGVDKWVYRLAPIVVFLPAYVSFAPLTFGNGIGGYNLDTGLIFVMAVSGLSTIGILMAGWGSANKFSMIGGLRGAAQVVSFEIPRVLSVIPVVMWTGATSLVSIGSAQAGYLAGFFPRWFIFYPIVGQVAFVIYLITTIAETNRVPFDIPEAESELVAGFHTEYGGMKFAIFFLSEYAYVFVGSVVGAVLFLGAGEAPLPFLKFIPSWFWFLGKTLVLMFVFLWARWTLPRLRVDRMMDLCWKIFLPWTLINIALAGAVILWRLR